LSNKGKRPRRSGSPRGGTGEEEREKGDTHILREKGGAILLDGAISSGEEGGKERDPSSARGRRKKGRCLSNERRKTT